MVGVFVLLFFVALLSTLSKTPFIKGKIGEWKVSRHLRNRLNTSTYQQLDDVTVPSINGTTQIDHVVVSPFGIFVIETKNFKGWIFGSNRDKFWTQTTPETKSRFLNPLRQNYAHVKALEALTGLDEPVFHSIVVFVGAAKFKTTMPDQVCVLANLVENIQHYGQELLSPPEVSSAMTAIKSGRLEPGFSTDYAHIKSLGERFEGSVQQGVTKGVAQAVRSVGITLGLKLIGLAGVILIAYLTVMFVQNTVSDLAIFKPQPQVPHSTSSLPPATNNLRNLIPNLRVTQQPQVKKTASAQQQTEQFLRCGYSIDTDRCTCLDKKGIKANVEFERCKALATGERN